jgi:hypothetical protein
VDVEITRDAELLVLEVMMLEVSNKMAHVVLAANEFFLPKDLAVTPNPRHTLDITGKVTDQQLRSEGAVTQLGVREV